MPTSPTSLDELSQLCEVRAPDASDAIDGVLPGIVARPASTAETSAVMRFAHAHGLAVTVRGAGTKQTWGRPPTRLDIVLETGRMDALVEHARGDLIVTAGAGMPLATLAERLAPSAQQLVVDDLAGGSTPRGSTVGGAVATNLSGPRRMWVGATRDLLIGVTIVRADGTVARGGGKVVKNVAGYDLGKLITGSFGTLAVVTEATLRLHPVPAASVWLEAEVALADLSDVLAAILGSQLVPAALEVDHPGGDAPARVAVLLTGTTTGVPGRVTAMRDLLPDATESEHLDWTARFPWPDRAPALKLTCQLSSVAALVAEAARRGVAIRGSAGAGVLYASGPVSGGTEVAPLRAWCRAHGGSLVVLDAPEKEHLDLWGQVGGLELMRRIKHEFDPTGVLAPGRFVGGI